MFAFDPRSFIITSACLGIMCSFLLMVLKRSFPKDIRGLQEWSVACAAMAASAFLFASRGVLSVLWSSVCANVLIVAGIMLMYLGLLRFDKRPIRKQARMLMLALAVIGLGLLWLTFGVDSYRGRVMLVCIVNMTLFFASGITVLQMRHQRGGAERFTAAVFLFTGTVSLLRFAVALATTVKLDPANDMSIAQHLYLASFATSLVGLSLGFILMANRKLQLQLQFQASRDSLTGIYSRGAFLEIVDNEVKRSDRYRQPLSLLIIDLDNFKRINDNYGHPVGDAVLRDFVQRTQQVLRSHDSFARHGGEEFAILLPNTSEEEAMVVANRIRQTIDEDTDPALPRYTISIGIAGNALADLDAATFFGYADRALYQAKRNGKDQAVLAVA